MASKPRDNALTWSDDAPTADGPERPVALEGRYEPRRELGRGGMGRVVLAWDVVLEREVAVKLMAVGRGRDAFLREARIAGRLEHPAIVPVHDAGLTSEGEAFYVMRLVPGRSLADAISAATPAERLGLLDALIDVARALAHAHGLGVVHRDLKPENVMLGPWGEVQVVDWGLARVLEEADPGLRSWGVDPAAGRVVGTPAYMSPEQARGAPADARSDVWALGMVLRELLTGERPWELTTAPDVVLDDVREGRVPPLPVDAPPELAAIVRRATAPDAAQRYPDAAGFVADLLAFRAGSRVSAHSYGLWDEWRRFDRRFWWPLRAVGALVVVGGLGLAGVTTAWRRAVDQERQKTAANERLDERNAALAAALRATLLEGARAADRDGRPVEAVGFAAAVLRTGDDPVARGIVARWIGRLPLERVEDLGPVPGDCTTLLGDPGGVVFCGGPAGTWAWADGAVTWHLPDLPSLLAADGELVVAAGPTGTVVLDHHGRERWRAGAHRRAALSPTGVALAQERALSLRDRSGAELGTATLGSRVAGLSATADGWTVWTAAGDLTHVDRVGRTVDTRVLASTATAVAAEGEVAVLAAVDHGGGIWDGATRTFTPFELSHGVSRAGMAPASLAWVAQESWLWLVDPADGAVSAPYPASSLLLQGDSALAVLDGRLVRLRPNPWWFRPAADGIAGLAGVVADAGVVRTGRNALVVDATTGRVREQIGVLHQQRAMGPVWTDGAGSWVIGAGMGTGMFRRTPAGTVRERTDATHFLTQYPGGWVAVVGAGVVVHTADGEWEVPLPVSHASAAVVVGADVLVTTADGSVVRVGPGGTVRPEARPAPDAELHGSVGCAPTWSWGSSLAPHADPSAVLQVDLAEVREVCAMGPVIALRRPWTVAFVDAADGHLLAEVGPVQTRSSGVARVGDWVWVSRLDGELERFWIPAFTLGPAELAGEVDRRSGARVGATDGAG